jgi:uncharacterized membrane protein
LELVFTTAALFAITLAASLIFYRRIKMAQREYEGSKDAVGTITAGFTRQVNKLEQSIQETKNDAVTAMVAAAEALKSSGETKEAVLQGLEEVKKLQDKVHSTESTVESFKKELQRLAATPRVQVQAPSLEAPIPVQQASVFDQLTDTELEVLVKIVELGEGTVPEIRDHIKKTREHTARMLKRLYDRGFIDRNTSGMPYRYSVRKEIKELILQRGEMAKVTT